VCPKGYYKGTNTCEKCPIEAETCLSGYDILKCKPGLIMNEEGRCVIGCPDGWYIDSSTKICKKCDTLCKTCKTKGSCLSCKD